MSTQMIGFALGGVMRRFLVDPPSMSMQKSFPHDCSLTQASSLAYELG